MLSDDRLHQILELVENSLDESEITGADLPARAYLSRFHFDRLVSAAIGEPPGAFRRRLLLERAAHRLSSTRDAVIDVALDGGYGSPEAFTRAFSRAYGASPTRYRAIDRRTHDLPAKSGIHFHPPGGLRIPALTRSDAMDVLVRMLDHHLWLVGEIIDRTGRLPDEVLDRPIELSVEGIDDQPTLRSISDRLVAQLEMWVAAVDGAEAVPAHDERSGLRDRLAVVAPQFRTKIVEPIQRGHADDTFVDATCEPPQTFTYGGLLAHVLTFSAVRRTMAIGALETAGIADLGSGDPMGFVGGSGDDATTITRTWE